MANVLKKIIDKICDNKNFLITAHMNLEGDALGSELAMYILLKKLKKKAVIYNQDETPQVYRFLPYSEVIKNSLEENNINVAIVLDCSDSSRTGMVKDALSRAKYIINIDHHISNTLFGDLNWVDAKAASTTQMLYKLFDKMKVMDRDIAFCLYTGIFVDSGNFTYANTTEETHSVAAQLIKYNFHHHKIYENLHSFCEDSDIKLISQITRSLKIDSSNKLCWAIIKKWEKKDYDLTEIIFSIMRLLKGIEVFILFKKITKNKVRVNFRSRSDFDVNKTAKFFGGGGHKRASGTTIWDTLDNTEKKVISFVKMHIKQLNSKELIEDR